jgi:hypothetical protein
MNKLTIISHTEPRTSLDLQLRGYAKVLIADSYMEPSTETLKSELNKYLESIKQSNHIKASNAYSITTDHAKLTINKTGIKHTKPFFTITKQ